MKSSLTGVDAADEHVGDGVAVAPPRRVVADVGVKRAQPRQLVVHREALRPAEATQVLHKDVVHLDNK